MESIQLITPDGQQLAADLALPDTPLIGGVVVCHPHPAYGGNRFDNVVEALFTALPLVGLATLRFDFRTGGGDGVGEQLDVLAAVDALAERTAAPLALAGYSFGAAVALATNDARINAVAAVAPPLSMMQIPTPQVPTLVLTPQHDQFCQPDAARTVVDEWPDCQFDSIESADHFLMGYTADVATVVATWLKARF